MENHGKELCSHEGAREGGMGRCGQLASKGRTDGVNSSILFLVLNMALWKQFVLFTLKFSREFKAPLELPSSTFILE